MNDINFYKDSLYHNVIGYDDLTINNQNEFVTLEKFTNGVIIGNIYNLEIKFIVYSNGFHITPWYKTKKPITRDTRNRLSIYRRNFRV